MFPEKPIGPRGSLAFSDENNILPKEYIIEPEPIDDDIPDTQGSRRRSSFRTSSINIITCR